MDSGRASQATTTHTTITSGLDTDKFVQMFRQKRVPSSITARAKQMQRTCMGWVGDIHIASAQSLRCGNFNLVFFQVESNKGGKKA